jgi:error-prone DNA polymerase
MPLHWREGGLDLTGRLARQLIHLVREVLGFPRHLSQHVGGMVLTHEPLCEIVPIENASMPGRTVVQWDKDDLDALGILKVDCLALGMLSAIRRSLDLLRDQRGQPMDMAAIPAEDPAVYEMI